MFSCRVRTLNQQLCFGITLYQIGKYKWCVEEQQTLEIDLAIFKLQKMKILIFYIANYGLTASLILLHLITNCQFELTHTHRHTYTHMHIYINTHTEQTIYC